MKKSMFGSLKEKLSRGESDKATDKRASGSSLALSNPGPAIQDDAPPAYSPVAPPIASSSAAPYLSHITNDDDKYAFLSSFDTVLVVDDSGSMLGPPWKEVAEVLRSITPICTAHDSDGIDLYFLNHKSAIEGPADKGKGGYYNINSPEKMERIFGSVKPYGRTPTGARLQNILKPYLASLQSAKDIDDVKPVNIIVITDGRPTDDPESVIVQHAMKLDKLEAPPHQVGIQFFQIGSDKDATEALRELDDELASQGVRDMVDTVTWDGKTSGRKKGLTADGILKVVLGAVIRRLDRRPVTNLSRA